ncbi:MAG: penicillin acylase family protein, partial [Ilumatobacteraceae bacterium]
MQSAVALGVVVALAAACSGDDDSGDAALSATTVTAGTAEPGAPTTEARDEPTATTAPLDDGSDDGEDEAPTTTEPVPVATEDRAYYILPPGNFGGIPTNDDSLDQLPLYDGLTPLRGDVTDADIEEFFLAADFQPIGDTFEEPTGRPGTTIVYDEFGVPHITGETREDLAFGAGWVTARDRGLWLDFGLGPARAAVADIPGLDAFSLVTDAQPFTPSVEAEQLVTDQVQLITETYGAEGEEIISDAQAYADGVNAYFEANDID